MQSLMRELDSTRPAPVQKDDPALLSALAFAADNFGPFYDEDAVHFKVKPSGEHLVRCRNHAPHAASNDAPVRDKQCSWQIKGLLARKTQKMWFSPAGGGGDQ